MNTSLLPTSLDINRVEQPALPAYMQLSGDRMRRLRAEWDSIYYEKSAVWSADWQKPEYQSVIGTEIKLDGELESLIGSMFPDMGVPFFNFGIHYILDGPMKKRNRAIVTFNMGIRL
jgi:hypothetical protein